MKPHECATVCHQVVDLYKNLLNSYVSDFYLDDHWNLKLSNSWKDFLNNLTLNQIADLLNYQYRSKSVLSPLTIICLLKILQTFALRRTQMTVKNSRKSDAKFMKYFWKNVKLKKRHEIEIMSEICYQMALKTGCYNIVDIGSGLGHLSRLLAFKYGFNICTFEANNLLVQEASHLDNNFEKILFIKSIDHKCKMKPQHISKRIQETLSAKEFENLVKQLFNNDNNNFKFGMVGLHPCGNLGATLLRLYRESPSACFINMVSCCYMKLSLEPQIFCGFPLSKFYKNFNFKLDYLSCETACHAIENYIVKIRTGDPSYLKVHSYRAALECLLNKVDTNLRHCQINNVKYEKGLSLKDYCVKATRKYNLIFCDTDLEHYENLIKDTWKNVVKFYSLRLLLAPLVESIILYDRLIYLQESKCDCDILPVFDSQISPRNHVLSAKKS